MTALLALGLAAALAGATAGAPSILGQWRTPVDASTVRIEPCGALVCARVESSTRLRAHPDQKDVLNHDASLRGRQIKDLRILELHPEGPERWGDGWVYDPMRGRVFKATAEAKPDGRLLVTGCAAAFLCQTQTWVRAR